MTGNNNATTEPTRSRKFGVSDSMVLIGGIALLLAYGKHDCLGFLQQFMGLIRAVAAYLGIISLGPPKYQLTHMSNYGSGMLWHGVQVSEHFVLIMTPVFLLMRLTRPRPSLHALLRQPGTIAALAVALGLIWVTGWLHRLFFGRFTNGAITPVAVGGTVALAWTCLALSRKWESERSWIDRLGRLLGGTAILVGLIALSMYGI